MNENIHFGIDVIIKGDQEGQGDSAPQVASVVGYTYRKSKLKLYQFVSTSK